MDNLFKFYNNNLFKFIEYMGKKGKQRKRADIRKKIRAHIKVVMPKCTFIYHIFIFQGETTVCVEEISNDSYIYYFLQSALDVMSYANTIKNRNGYVENLSDPDINRSILKIKCKIMSDFKRDGGIPFKYLKYIYEIMDCSKTLVKI